MKKEIFEMYANAIAKQFHLELDQMLSKDRRRDLVDARQMLYYLCMERRIRVAYIQRFLAECDCEVQHSTIIHGYKKAKKLIESDPDYLKVVNEIKKNDADSIQS